MKRVAILLRGAVSRVEGSYRNGETLETNFINLEACAASVRRYIIEANPNWQCDFYCHCWNPELIERIGRCYHPKAALFESNEPYRNEISSKCESVTFYAQVSSSLSLKKVIELVKQEYDLFLIYRYDLLLWKSLLFDTYDPEKIYSNGHIGGDFHFLCGQSNLPLFSRMYDWCNRERDLSPHVWTEAALDYRVEKDEILPGKDQEVIRKCFRYSVIPGHLSRTTLESFGTSMGELASYTAD